MNDFRYYNLFGKWRTHSTKFYVKATPHWASDTGCEFVGWCSFSTFDWIVGHATLWRSRRFASQMYFAIIAEIYHLSSKKFTVNEKDAVRGCGFLLSQKPTKKRISTQIVISRATLCTFQHASYQFHYSNHPKVRKIFAAPQSCNPHARHNVGQPEK